MSTTIELFQAGQLDAALQQAADDVKSQPANLALRSLFCEVLCFVRDWERADKQLDAMAKINPNYTVGISMLKHLIRSEVARAETFEQGRVPSFISQPTPALQKRLQALTFFRTGEPEQARALITEAESLEPELSGTFNNTPFVGVRDLDDLLGQVVEIFTATGEYYWVSFSEIQSLEFDPPVNLTDQLWRAARIGTTGKLAGRVYLPVLYFGTERHADGLVKVGRASDWTEAAGGVIQGQGQHEYLIGEEAVSLLSISTLEIDQPAEAE